MTSVAVCGFGRCGSTMVMSMLAAGGIQPVAGSAEISHELEDSRRFPDLTAADLDGRSVKLLDAASYRLMPTDRTIDWRIIWMDRDPHEQARSQVKLLRAVSGERIGPMAVYRFAESYRKDRPRALRRLRRFGEQYTDSYENVLADPHAAANRFAGFLAPAFDLDVAAAAAAVHDRGPLARRDLTFETTGAHP